MGDCHDHGLGHQDYDPDGDWASDQPRFGVGELVMVGHTGPYPVCWFGYSQRSHSIRYGLRVREEPDLEFFDENELFPVESLRARFALAVRGTGDPA